MPNFTQLPKPVQQQVRQLVQGTAEEIAKTPENLAKGALNQLGLESFGKPSQSGANTEAQSGLSPEAEMAKQLEVQDQVKKAQLIKQLKGELEAEIIKRQRMRVEAEKHRQEQFEVLARQKQEAAAVQPEGIPQAEKPKKHGSPGTGKRRGGSSLELESAKQKSAAETAATRQNG
jgi:hypothetical protein